MAITKVWIEEGCIVCNACDAECPDVFLVTDTTCIIKEEVSFPVEGDLESQIEAAAAGCPVEVIKYEK